MKLNILIQAIEPIYISDYSDIEISNISYDSKKILPGGLFIALKGRKSDGNAFINDAIANGACAILSDSSQTKSYEIPFILVENARKEMGNISAKFYDYPSSKLKIIAITGTNGKTSTAYITAQLLQYSNQKVGIIGTSGVRINNQLIKNISFSTFTMPESCDLQYILSYMVLNNVNIVVMEATSMGLKMGRLSNCNVDVAVFTNISPEHLDDHGSYEDYIESKSFLFTKSKMSIINIDDSMGNFMKSKSNSSITFGQNTEANWLMSNIEFRQGISLFTLSNLDNTYKYELPLLGLFNVYNTVAALLICNHLKVNLEFLVNGVLQIKPIEGRLEKVSNSYGMNIIIDFAHTPDALLNILTTIKRAYKGRLIIVFGCGGDRDKSKRPIMGQIASEYCDFVIITNDNPRLENPKVICNEIVAGINSNKNYLVIQDRRMAIYKAISMSIENDIIVIAGKGIEETQTIGSKIYEFNDKDVVLDYFRNKEKEFR